MKTFAIGDVHGQFSTLKKLLAKLPVDLERDELVFLGDLIDRGPSSRQVLEFVMQLQTDFPNVTVLKGNHEETMLKSCHDAQEFSFWMAMGGDTTYLNYCTKANILWTSFAKEFPSTTYQYLENLPFCYENQHAIFVHAGAYFDQTGEWKTDKVIYALWYRGKDFFSKYHGKTIIVGHTPTNKIRRMLGEALLPENQMTAWSRNNIIAIDCGAGHEGQLCAVELPSGDLYYQPLKD